MNAAHAHYSEIDLTWVIWLGNNLLTGLAYLAIATLLWTSRKWLVREEYRPMFAMFIVTCGLHHIVHAAGVYIDVTYLQIVADTTMTVVSLATAIIAYSDKRV